MKYSDIASTETNKPAIRFRPSSHKPEISIDFPVDGQRARKVLSRSKTIASGKHPSWKMDRQIHYESLHECNAFKLFDACTDILYFLEQPCRIRYAMKGEQRLHYPDVLIKTPFGNDLIEIKTSEEAATDEVRERTAFMQSALPPLGYGYRLFISDELARNPRLGNVEKLLRFGQAPVSPVMREQIRQMFKAAGNRTRLGAFRSGDWRRYRAALYRLMLEGVIEIDFNQPFGDDSPICWVGSSVGGASWA